MFDQKISTFKCKESKKPINMPLARWVRSTMNGDSKHAKKVKRYRQTAEVELKLSLPLATVSGLFSGRRKKGKHDDLTGWIALDIDAKDNPDIKDAELLRDKIGQIVYVAFAGLSVSGRGVWALAKVANPKEQERYFEQLQLDFKSRGIILDSTKGKNPNDARFYSFDPDAVINEDFKVYDRLPEEKPRPTVSNSQSSNFSPSYNGDDTRSKVERLISKINTDITGGYDNWLSLGFALESEFGESGRTYFHAISQYHSEYDDRECDRQYTHCLKHRGSGIGIGTLFHVCKQHGITLDKQLNGSQSKYESQKNENPAPYGFNPYTGEVFDKRGYPSSWDDVQLDPKEELMNRDATFTTLCNLFDAEPLTEIKLINK